jgi:DNA-binding NarL/FixJ family response regulator
MSWRTTVAILSEARYLREALAARLEDEPELEVVGGARTLRELLAHPRTRSADVLLVHTSQDSVEGSGVVWEIRTLLPAAQVVVIVGFRDDEAEMTGWLHSGAAAYLGHDASSALLRDALLGARNKLVSREGLVQVLHRLLAASPIPRKAVVNLPPDPLTSREEEILQLLRSELPNKEIARRLGVRKSTVKTHVHSILTKLRVGRRWDLTRPGQHHARQEEDS